MIDFNFNFRRHIRETVKQRIVQRANAAVRVFQQCNAQVKNDALAGSVASNIQFYEEMETLQLVKDIFKGYSMAVQVDPKFSALGYNSSCYNTKNRFQMLLSISACAATLRVHRQTRAVRQQQRLCQHGYQLVSARYTRF